MEAEIKEITKRKDGIFVVVQCGEQRETCVFVPQQATEENITRFAEQVYNMVKASEVPISDTDLNKLKALEGKKFDVTTKKLK